MNEPESVAGATREKVEAAAALLNYVPSSAARSLRSGRSGTIALLVGDISQPFHGVFAQSVSAHAATHGMSVLLYDLAHSVDRLVDVLTRLPQQGVDGVVIATADDIVDPRVQSALDFLQEARIPVVTSTPTELVGVTTVAVDFVGLTTAATELLLANGRTRVAMVAGSPNSSQSGRFVRGYSAGIGQSSPLIAYGNHTFDGGVRAVVDLLDAAEPFDAILVGTLPMALGALRVFEHRRLEVPSDIALVILENVPLARQMTPSVTSFAIDPDANGVEIVRLLIDQVHDRTARPADALQGALLVGDTFVPKL